MWGYLYAEESCASATQRYAWAESKPYVLIYEPARGVGGARSKVQSAMVFASVVVDILNRYLRPYVKKLDPSQIKVGVWKGEAATEMGRN